MQQLIENITTKLVGLLPEDKDFYLPEELYDYDFPPFVVRSIKVQLEVKLEEQVSIPDTRWANLEAPAVQKAWQLFVNATESEVRLPAGDVEEIIGSALEEAMEMLIKPRHKIPEVLFEGVDSLNYDELLERLDRIVIYRHFSTLLSRYMERKNLDRLTKDQCREVIARTDEKTTEHYSPLNWSQVLEPLFSLLDDKIDTDIVGMFFDDHNMTRFARHFRSMDGEINRKRFIEELSSPKLLDTEGFDQAERERLELEKQKNIALQELEKSKEIEEESETEPGAGTLPDEETAQAPDEEEAFAGQETVEEPSGEEEETEADEDEERVPEITKEQNEADLVTDSEEEQLDIDDVEELEQVDAEEPDKEPDLEVAEEDLEEEPDFAENPILNHFHETRKKKGTVFEVGEEEEPINKLFLADDEEEDTEEGSESYSLNEIFGRQQEEAGSRPSDRSDSGDEAGTREERESENEGRSVIEQVVNREPEEETPMWKRFLPDDEKDVGEQAESNKTAGPTAIGSSERKESETGIELDEMLELFEGERNRFVDEIFRGSDRAFEEAIEELATKESWRSASRYIEKEVFKRNLVDMYSEVAVDFTDLLQSYFLKKTKT